MGDAMNHVKDMESSIGLLERDGKYREADSVREKVIQLRSQLDDYVSQQTSTRSVGRGGSRGTVGVGWSAEEEARVEREMREMLLRDAAEQGEEMSEDR